ncbi:MAG: putative C2H2 Zn-finger protein [Cryomorphaceae bacterium]
MRIEEDESDCSKKKRISSDFQIKINPTHGLPSARAKEIMKRLNESYQVLEKPLKSVATNLKI